MLVVQVQWISEESESVHLKFESNRKLNLKEYRPLRKGIATKKTSRFLLLLNLFSLL